jgi:hypothetical protein
MITSVSNGRLSRSSDPAFSLRGSIGIAQRIARLAYRVLNLSADIAFGVNQQLFCGEQHLNLTDAGHLTNRGFHLAGAGGAVHAINLPAVAGVAKRFGGRGVLWRRRGLCSSSPPGRSLAAW